MQNKNMFLETIFYSPSARPYRSVRYKSNRSSTLPSKDYTENNQVLRTSPSLKTYPKKKRTNLSLCTNLKLRKAITLQNEQQNAVFNPIATYNQTWNTLMNQPEFIKKLDHRLQFQRVCLPSIAQYGPSLFTSLDPVALPLEYITTQIAKAHKQLPAELIEIQLIRGQIKNLHRKMLTNLQQCQKYGRKQINQLRNHLRKDRVNQLETKMRFKRQCQQLAQEDCYLTQSIQRTKCRLEEMQQTIFSCKPFNLSLKQMTNEAGSNNYF